MKAVVSVQVGKAHPYIFFTLQADAMLLDHISHGLPVKVVDSR